MLEQRGARVFLFELPYAEPIEGSRAAVITRNIIHDAFPDSKRWLPIEVNRGELRWADGVHLDERSAVIMTQAVERALASARGDAITEKAQPPLSSPASHGTLRNPRKRTRPPRTGSPASA